jgi:hypothetical protein
MKTHEPTTTKLEVLKYQMIQRVSHEFMKSLEAEAFADCLSSEFTILLKMNLLGQSNIQKYSIGIEVPKNIWQHIREFVLPSFWLDRFPVKTKTLTRTVEFNHMALLPDFKIPPGNGSIVMHTVPPMDYNINKL